MLNEGLTTERLNTLIRASCSLLLENCLVGFRVMLHSFLPFRSSGWTGFMFTLAWRGLHISFKPKTLYQIRCYTYVEIP